MKNIEFNFGPFVLFEEKRLYLPRLAAFSRWCFQRGQNLFMGDDWSFECNLRAVGIYSAPA